MACFAGINVSHSSVATYARCGGIFNIHLTTNFPNNLPVEFFLNRLRLDGIIFMSLWSRFFGNTQLLGAQDNTTDSHDESYRYSSRSDGLSRVRKLLVYRPACISMRQHPCMHSCSAAFCIVSSTSCCLLGARTQTTAWTSQ